MYTFDFSLVLKYLPELLEGCAATLGLALAGMALALIIGLVGVAAKRSSNRVARVMATSFVEAIRNTPFLVQIFFLYFALPYFGIMLNPTATAIIALGVNGGAYSIEIIRGGVQSVAHGQIEAGAALGLSRQQIFRCVVLKPALRAIYPALTSQFILLTLTSSVCSSISAHELTSVGQHIDSQTFKSFEVYLTLTMLYLLISWLLMTLFVTISRTAFSYPTK
ncbi:amino acid ABC transporter permease [Caballeronia sp. J97]|uniref:amino acid ABC transporter permease n=1 Tax=Caballeronia sp. J97 TaxID=2805429 RepID=UPI002AB0356C|nr:amino acid ABC transporter permease [Caballeronia sp. J97]